MQDESQVKVVALSPIDHDGVSYVAGQTIAVFPKQAKVLVDSKVALPVDGTEAPAAVAEEEAPAAEEAAPEFPEEAPATEATPVAVQVKGTR